MEYLLLQEGAKLEKGTFIRLQPHSVDFLSIADLRAAPEGILNCVVEFACPLDYEEPERPVQPVKAVVAAKSAFLRKGKVADKEKPGFLPFQGQARRLDGKSSTETDLPSKQKVHIITVKPLDENRTKGKQKDDVESENSKEKQFQASQARRTR
ncbi:hypothetical protein RCOM_0813620 [Ricinus communis]|uniref:Uncharacterized protein n=1 Tax=Ricinus communis TaxID=3988 RepID=B9RYI7_RICCO|nr:hypothetical protein RCOM_0813620 [Ricinus communis]